MKVLVTGASGNIGTRVTTALKAAPEVDEIVGLSRRRPDPVPDDLTWVSADLGTDDLTDAVRGADVVVHLAWLLQPSMTTTPSGGPTWSAPDASCTPVRRQAWAPWSTPHPWLPTDLARRSGSTSRGPPKHCTAPTAPTPSAEPWSTAPPQGRSTSPPSRSSTAPPSAASSTPAPSPSPTACCGERRT